MLTLPSPDPNRAIAKRSDQAQSLGLTGIEKTQKRELEGRGGIELTVISHAEFAHDMIGESTETVDTILWCLKKGIQDEINQTSRQMPNERSTILKDLASKHMRWWAPERVPLPGNPLPAQPIASSYFPAQNSHWKASKH
jgi:hypothetical protein